MNTMIEPKKIFGNFRKLSLASREDGRETRAISVKKFPNIFLARKSSIQERLIKNLSSWCEINGSREADKKSLPPVVKIAMSKSKAIKNLISLFSKSWRDNHLFNQYRPRKLSRQISFLCLRPLPRTRHQGN